MNRHLISSILIYILLIAIQILICNHIIIFNSAIVFIFIYTIINLKIDFNTVALLTWAFFGGVAVDICSDTLGINALACTILAILKRPIFYAYVPKDDRTKNIIPSIKSLGIANYSKFLFTLVCIFCLIVFCLEFLNFTRILTIIKMAACSAILSFLVLLGLDSMLERKVQQI